MRTRYTTADLTLVVPFYNEERHLPNLLHSLRQQTATHVPVVFINNASTDTSATLVQLCEEVRTGRWFYLEEQRLGKFYAMRTGTAFCQDRFNARYVGFLDADSYCADDAWVRYSLDLIAQGQDTLGYTYSPFEYFGFEWLPFFNMAYRAYNRILRLLTQQIGWLANGQGFICAMEIMARYFQAAHITTEIDLRCALLALAEGRQAYFNPSIFLTSGRRTTVNAENFFAWCFYERTFYTQKDINTPAKLPLNVPAAAQDLTPDMVGQFFQRRALKVTCRHLVPFLLFSRGMAIYEKIQKVLGLNVTGQFDDLAQRFCRNPEYLLTDSFETMIMAIERHPVCITVTQYIARLMHDQYTKMTAPPFALSASA